MTKKCFFSFFYKSIDDNLVLTSKYFKGVIKDLTQIYKKGGLSPNYLALH